MKSVPFAKLKPGLKFASETFLDKNYILLTPEIPMDEELIKRLKAWGFIEVFQKDGVPDPSEQDPDEAAATAVDLSKDEKEFQDVQKFYGELLEFTQMLFKIFIQKNQINDSSLTEQIKEIIQIVKEQRRHILRLTDLNKKDYAYLTYHSVNTTILVAAMGESMKIPTHKLIDLCKSAMLHEAGMLKLPQKLQNSRNPLTFEEKKALSAHPIIGFRTLKSLGFSPNVYVPVLEHHERMDGQGYPQGIRGDRISEFSKILAVASAYDAQLSSRPYRDARSGHFSLLDLLKDIGRNHDETILRNLVYTIGLYPIGSIVEIKTGALARVVDSNHDEPKKPIIRILTSREKRPLAEAEEINIMDSPGHSVRRVMDREEIQNLQKLKVLPS